MGEIADMMIEGDLCECCGAYIGDGDGFTRYCSEECARDRGVNVEDQPRKRSREKINNWFLYDNTPKGDGPALAKFIRKTEFDGMTKGKRDKTGKLVIFLQLEGVTVAAVRCEEQFYTNARTQLSGAINV